MFALRRTGFYIALTIMAALALLQPPLSPGSSGDRPLPVEIEVLLAALATAGLVTALITTRLLFGRAEQLVESLHVRIHAALKIQRLEVVSAGQIKDSMLLLARLGRFFATITVWGMYLSRLLSLYPEAAPLAREIQVMVLAPLEAMGQATIDYLPNLVQIGIILLVTRYALKIVHLFFHAVGARIIVLPDFYPDWAEPTYKIVRMLVFVFIPFMIVPLLPGANSQFFEEISFFVGLLVSLGSTSAIKNMTAGIVLTYTRSFQIGDRVRIGEAEGIVVEKSLFVTRIQTPKNEQVAIPNGMVLDSSVVNFSALASSDGLILHTSVTIGYDVDWRQVQELLIGGALRTPHILPDPPPFVLQTSLDDYYVAYEINAYTDEPALMPAILSELRQNILDEFHIAGVEIMSPAYSALRNGSEVAIPDEPAPVVTPVAISEGARHTPQRLPVRMGKW